MSGPVYFPCQNLLIDTKWLLIKKWRITAENIMYRKTCLKRPLKKMTKIGFQYQLLLNAGQKYCRMLQGEHSAILSTFIKLPFAIKTFVLSIFEWPLQTGFTVISQMFGILQFVFKFN